MPGVEKQPTNNKLETSQSKFNVLQEKIVAWFKPIENFIRENDTKLYALLQKYMKENTDFNLYEHCVKAITIHQINNKSLDGLLSDFKRAANPSEATQLPSLSQNPYTLFEESSSNDSIDPLTKKFQQMKISG